MGIAKGLGDNGDYQADSEAFKAEQAIAAAAAALSKKTILDAVKLSGQKVCRPLEKVEFSGPVVVWGSANVQVRSDHSYSQFSPQWLLISRIRVPISIQRSHDRSMVLIWCN
jgi:hypothetical protein